MRAGPDGVSLYFHLFQWPASLGAQFAALGAFALNAGSRDATLIADLPPGIYTVVVSGVDGGMGEVLVEIYDAS